VRSLASQTARDFAEADAGRGPAEAERGVLLNWYAVDFREELSAHGAGVLEAQAEFVAQCMADISALGEGPAPRHLILVGHSMGGIVAKAALLRAPRGPNAPRVPLLVTLATPNAAHPFLAEHALAAFYGELQAAWAGAPQKPAVLSVSGGWRDALVDEGLALERGAHAVSSSTEGVPGVMLSADHQAIVWCNELVRKLASTLARVGALARDEPDRLEDSSRLSSAVRELFLGGASDTLAANAWSEDLAAAASREGAAGACGDAPPLKDAAGLRRESGAEVFKSALPVAEESGGARGGWVHFAWDLRGLTQIAVRVDGCRPCSGFRAALWNGAKSVDVTHHFSHVTSAVGLLLLSQPTLERYDSLTMSVRRAAGSDGAPAPHLLVQPSPGSVPTAAIGFRDILTAAAGGAANFEPFKHHMVSKFHVRRGATWLPFGLSATEAGVGAEGGSACLPTAALVWDARLGTQVAQSNRSVYAFDSAVHSAALDPLYAADPAVFGLILTDPTCAYKVVLEPLAWVGILKAVVLKGSAVPALALGVIFIAYQVVTGKVERGDSCVSATVAVGAVSSSMVPFFAFGAVKAALLSLSRDVSLVVGFADVILYIFGAGLAVLLVAGAEGCRSALLHFKLTQTFTFTAWMHAGRGISTMHSGIWASFVALVALLAAAIHPSFAYGFSALVCFAASLRDHLPAQALLASAVYALVSLVGAPSLVAWLHSCSAHEPRPFWSTWPEFCAASAGVFYSLMALRPQPGQAEFASRRLGALPYVVLFCGVAAALEVPYQLPFAVAVAVAPPAAAATLFVGHSLEKKAE